MKPVQFCTGFISCAFPVRDNKIKFKEVYVKGIKSIDQMHIFHPRIIMEEQIYLRALSAGVNFVQ